MTLLFSRPFEELQQEKQPILVHTLIVGSGYGAAMAALALAMRDDYKDKKIMVIERGNEYLPGDFPKTISDLPAHISTQGNNKYRTGYADSLFDVRVGKNVIAIVGSGLGGTSLINANVAINPDKDTISDWPTPINGEQSWMARLGSSLEFVQSLLKVQQHPSGDSLNKVKALKTLSTAIGNGKATHKLADLAVNFSDEKNTVGIGQNKCNDCGNCFTGCNIGAKSTLAMNAWPLAKTLGVDIVTGGTVQLLEKSNDPSFPWRVSAYRTPDANRIATYIFAKNVILAAGTFGSTEILLRSRAPKSELSGLHFSEKLGSGFSLNGDDIAFGYGQSQPVNAYAKFPSGKDINLNGSELRAPGPTIVSMIELSNVAGKQNTPRLLQDATIPQAIARLWGEVMTSQAMTHAYVSDTPSAWHKQNSHADPLAVSANLMDHHQTLLTMGTDDAAGALSYSEKYQQLQITWPDAAKHHHPDDVQTKLDKLLSAAADERGFDGGLYLTNPFWSPLPSGFNKVFEGADKLGGTHLCNHPLGGCAMAKRADAGVVNTHGQVFSGSNGDAFHQGLYVLDGSIIPGALGINPFMTIAALAHHLALSIDGKPTENSYKVPSIDQAPTITPKDGHLNLWPVPTLSFEFKERLFGPSIDDPSEEEAAKKLLKELGLSEQATHKNRLVIDATISFPDLYSWLDDPSKELNAKFSLYENNHPDKTIDTIQDEYLSAPLVSAADGRVQLFARDQNGGWTPTLKQRAKKALKRLRKLRGDEANLCTYLDLSNLFKVRRVARVHGNWRYLRYSFSAKIDNKQFDISGSKCLAYDGDRDRKIRDESNPWTTLTNLNLTFTNKTNNTSEHSWFRVDLIRMAKNINALQSTGTADTPQVVTAVASFGALAFRSLLQTHLWSFGAPDYDRFPTQAKIDKLNHVVPETITWKDNSTTKKYKVSVIPQKAGQLWRLLKADSKNPTKKPAVLLIHGLAHGSRVFYTETIDKSMAGCFLNDGHEVWLLDHGLSTCLKLSDDYQPNIDEISTQVADAVNYVYEKGRHENGQGIIVFSHCVGSAALTMAILSGKVTNNNDGTSRIKQLIMHAVPPWIQPSESNLLRAYIGVFFKDNFFPEAISPIPNSADDKEHPPSAASTLLDRIASSFPWKKSDFDIHHKSEPYKNFGRAICNRMTALYGYEWQHEKLDERTHAQLHTLVGTANADAYRQLYFLLNRKRVTDCVGRNLVYAETLANHWTFSTLFVHGDRNEVFNHESSTLSANILYNLRKFEAGKKSKVAASTRLRIVPNYGHMDLIFGKHAWKEVFDEHIQWFLDNPDADNSTLQPPKSSVCAPTSLYTGPIVSLPQKKGSSHYLRIWAETNEFQSNVVSNVVFKPVGPNPFIGMSWNWRNRKEQLDKILVNNPIVNKSSTNTLFNSTFWLGDFHCDTVKGEVIGYAEIEPPGSLVPPSAPLGSHAIQPSSSAPPDGSTQLCAIDGSTTMNWTKLPWYQRFMHDTSDNRVSFVLGSCWYPGSWFDHQVSDRIFSAIRPLIEDNYGIDHLLLVGDQIYADASYAIFDIKEDRERYQECYRRAYRSEYASWVLRHVPTYFAVDDHEFRDSYPTRQSVDPEDIRKISEMGDAAAKEAWNFQMHHGKPPTSNQDNQLWHAFDSAGFHFFVFDTRSERNPSGQNVQRIIGVAQAKGFHDWVLSVSREESDRPIFIVTGSPLAPIPTDELASAALARSGDTLRAYPEFLELLLNELAPISSRHPVVMLSGDPHFSSWGRVAIHKSGQQLNLTSIISSGLNASLPFTSSKPDDYEWGNSTFVPDGSGMSITVSSPSEIRASRSHALLLDVKRSISARWQLVMRIIDADVNNSTNIDPIEL